MSQEIGFTRLMTDGSIYVKRDGDDFIAVLNAVDDQLYFATKPELKKWFEEATTKRFDVQLLGQAHWYLQARITQLHDYSIILDQSRYAANLCVRYLPPISEAQIEDLKYTYSAPLPSNAVFTKQDCSKTCMDDMDQCFVCDYSDGKLFTYDQVFYSDRSIS